MKSLENLALYLWKLDPLTVTAGEAVNGSLKFLTLNGRRDTTGEDYHVSLGCSVCKSLQCLICIVFRRDCLQSHLSCKFCHIHSCSRCFRNRDETFNEVASAFVCNLCIRISGLDTVKNRHYMGRVTVIVAEHHCAVGRVRTEYGDLSYLLRFERKNVVLIL